MSLDELPTYFQFAFTARQREILRAYHYRMLVRIQHNRQDSQESESASDYNPVAMHDYLLRELDRFGRYLDADQYQKVGLSAPFLPWLTQELRMDLDAHIEELDLLEPSRQDYREPTAANATVYELLQLHYQLTRGFLHHFDQAVDERFRDPYLPEEVRQRRQHWPRRRYIDTAGMDEVAVFTALYNAANPKAFDDPTNEEGNITEQEAARLLQRADKYFDYIGNRRLKFSLSELLAGRVNVTSYDEGNGPGAAQRAIAHLPRT